MPPLADEKIKDNEADAVRAVKYMAVKVTIFVLVPLVVALTTAFWVLS